MSERNIRKKIPVEQDKQEAAKKVEGEEKQNPLKEQKQIIRAMHHAGKPNAINL